VRRGTGAGVLDKVMFVVGPGKECSWDSILLSGRMYQQFSYATATIHSHRLAS
jgi:hypothetical protein